MDKALSHGWILGTLLLLSAIAMVGCSGDTPTPTSASPATLIPTPTFGALPFAPSTPTPVPTQEGTEGSLLEPELPPETGGQVGDVAPDFMGITSWINSEPLSMEELRGKVVLVDFWTFTCVNCIRTYSHLKEWHQKYADRGLVIVGVHSPEFEFERLRENVVLSAEENSLTYPIAQDNEFETWQAFGNMFWPAKYLVDGWGKVRYTHFGEGAYDETEETIRQLLGEAGADLSDITAGADPGPVPDARAITEDPATLFTRELYAGFVRNAVLEGFYVAHQEYYETIGEMTTYTDPGDHQNQFMYLQGPWLSGPESLVHARDTSDFEDYIALKFSAVSVNAVIEPLGEGSFEVQVTMDGRPLTPEEAGADVVIKDGRSVFTVDGGRMYMVVELPDYGIHELKLSSNSSEFALFAFTFGAYAEGP